MDDGLDGLDNESGKEQVSLDGVADFFDLVVLICICITDAKYRLKKCKIFVPIKHVYHKDQPLHIRYQLLRRAQILFSSFND